MLKKFYTTNLLAPTLKFLTLTFLFMVSSFYLLLNSSLEGFIFSIFVNYPYSGISTFPFTLILFFIFFNYIAAQKKMGYLGYNEINNSFLQWKAGIKKTHSSLFFNKLAWEYVSCLIVMNKKIQTATVLFSVTITIYMMLFIFGAAPSPLTTPCLLISIGCLLVGLVRVGQGLMEIV